MQSKAERAIARLKENDPLLTTLNLAWDYIGDEGAWYLGEALLQNHTLIWLNLAWNHIGAEGMQHLGEALLQNRTLTSLSLINNNIGAEGVRHLGKVLAQNHTLTSLDLGGNNIGAEGARHLGKVLTQNDTLTSLDLGFNYIGAEGARHLGKVLAQNHTLTSLALGLNNIGAEGAQHLGEILAQNHTLTSLDLGGNNIGAEGARHLGKVLVQNDTLTSLDLGDNNIGAEGARHLGKVLAQNDTLTSLNLSWNDIGDEGARHLGEVLAQNHTLSFLDFNYNNISDEGARQLAKTIIKNHGLLNLDLSVNGIDYWGKSKKSLTIIEKKLHENAVIYHMMGHLSYLNNEEITCAKGALNTLGLGAIYLPHEPLPSGIRSFFHTLLTDLAYASRQNAYTVMIIPFSYTREFNLLRVFFSLNSPDDTLWLSKDGFCFPLIKATDQKVMKRPYLCPEWNVLFDPETGVEPDQDWVNCLSHAVEILDDTLGFVPRLSFQYSGLTGEDLRNLLAYLATNPPIEYLDLSHNPVMLKIWNKEKTEKMIRRNSVFNSLHQLTKNTLLRELNLSHTQITLDQTDYPKLIPIFNEQRNLAIELSGNYLSSYMRWKANDTKEKTSKALCRFFQKLPFGGGALNNDPLNHFFEGLHFVRTPWVENSFFQAIAVCLNQDSDELRELFKIVVLERADLWQTDLEKGDSIEGCLKRLDSGKLDLTTLNLMSRFLNAPLIVFSSDHAPVISKGKKPLSGHPFFLYWDGEQQYHALAYGEDFDAQGLLNRVVSAMQLEISVFYDKRRTQSEHLVLQHGFWSERKTMYSVFSALPQYEELTLGDHTVRHVALCCQNSATGGHAWLIIEGMHHFGQAFFLCADLTTVNNRTTQINIHTEFCPHRFKKGLLENKIVARVYPNQSKGQIKALLKRIEEEHERSHYRYGKTGGNSLITSSQQLAKSLSEEEQKDKTVNCMQWAIERLLEYEIIDQEEAAELSGNVLRYWPINIKESKTCCVM